MRNNNAMIGRQWWVIGLAPALLATAGPAVWAQEPTVKYQSILEEAGIALPVVLDVSFDGGTIEEYTRLIRRELEKKTGVNIVVMPEVAAVPVPRIDLRSVSIDAAFRLLERCEGRGLNRMIITPYIEKYEAMEEGEHDIYVISANHVKVAPESPREVQVWSVADLLVSGPTIEEIITAIETVVALEGSAEKDPVVKFHPGTSLIIAHGPKHRLRGIDFVIEGIRHGQQLSRQSSASMDALRTEIAQLKEKVEMLTLSIKECEQRVQEGAAKPKTP